MTERINLDNYADLRDISRQFCGTLQTQAQGYIETVRHLFRPAGVFGPYITGSHKDAPRDAGVAMTQFRAFFAESVAAKPMLLDTTVPEVMEIQFGTPVLTPMVYTHEVTTRTGPRTITVTAPLTWLVGLPEFPVSKLVELAANPKRSPEELHKVALHAAALHFTVMRNPRLPALFEALRFPLRSERIPQLGGFPVLVMRAPGGTVRPPDDVIAQVVRYAGQDAIEEIVNYDEWSALPDPMAEMFRPVGESMQF